MPNGDQHSHPPANTGTAGEPGTAAYPELPREVLFMKNGRVTKNTTRCRNGFAASPGSPAVSPLLVDCENKY
jgi:hypothetical protein